MSDKLEAGMVRHSYIDCKWGYMLTLCSKFDIKPTRTQDGDIRSFISLTLEKEGIDITWHCSWDDREKWDAYWSCGEIKRTLLII